MKGLIICLPLVAGCATTAPTVLTKTVTVDVPVPQIVAVPAELTADCPAAPLAGSTVGAVIDRLESVETALAQCRGQVAAIKNLGAALSKSAP